MRLMLSILLMLPLFVFSQSVNIADGAYIRMADGAKMVILSSSPDAFDDSGQTTGGILMEGEDAEVIWKVDNGTGTYMVPFVSTSGDRIPFTYEINTAGTGGGEIHFTSYETAVDNTQVPTGVNHITDDYGFDNSTHMADRWWIVDPIGYTNKPEGEYTFTYDDDDLTGNTITESNLTVQRYNDDDDLWLDWLYAPTVNTTTNQLTIIIANLLDQYPVWVMVDISDPLPIELVSMRVDCDNMILYWTTASETNTDITIIQGSNDAFNWTNIEEVQSAGNSNQLLNYSIKVDNYDYYRLNQFDLDGSNEYSDVIYGCPDFEGGEVNLYPTLNDGRFFINHSSVYQIDIMDMMGNLVYSQKTSDNYFDMDIANGKYILRMYNQLENHTFRFIKTK